MATDALTTQNFATYVSGLPSVTAVGNSDVFYVIQSGTSKKAVGSQIIGGGGQPGQQNTNYFNVKNSPYNATGNGTTDDTAAINSAIAALNAAGAGVLYFPAGDYRVTAPLTVITANCIIRGDGATNEQYLGASLINYQANNSSCLTITNAYGKVQDIAIQYTGSATPVTGSAGITVTSTNPVQKVDFDSVTVGMFLINIDIQTGHYWQANNIISLDFAQYGIRIKNINNPDAGGWSIVNSVFSTNKNTGTTGMRIESSGAGKVANCKFNSGPGFLANGIDLQALGATSDFMVTNCSFENFTNTGINIVGPWPGIAISTCQFGVFSPAATGAGILITNNPITCILGCAFIGTGWNCPALIVLNGSTGVSIGPNVVDSSITIPVHN